MGRLLGSWLSGVSYLFYDDTISFYTFFNIILAECAYLWGFQSTKTATIFTLILIGYIFTVLIFSWLKGNYEGTFIERVCALIYVIVLATIFAIGCLINSWMCIILTAIPMAITFLFIQIKALQKTAFMGKSKKTIRFLSNLFSNKLFNLISTVFITFTPLLSFSVFLAFLPNLTTTLKIVIMIIWGVCSPFFALIEDEFGACNIFEIAYDITWNLEDEFNKNNKE